MLAPHAHDPHRAQALQAQRALPQDWGRVRPTGPPDPAAQAGAPPSAPAARVLPPAHDASPGRRTARGRGHR